MEVGWNEHQVGHVVLESCARRSLMFEISPEWVTGELDRLWFGFPRTTSAANTGILTEKRPRAAGSSALTFVQQEIR